MPNISVYVRQGLASVGVNQLDIHKERHPSLVFHDVFADQFASNVWKQSELNLSALVSRYSQYGP